MVKGSNGPQCSGLYDNRDEGDNDLDCVASTSGSFVSNGSSSGRAVLPHPEMQDGEELVVLPGLSSYSQQPSGWIRWDQPRRDASGTHSLEDLWELGDDRPLYFPAPSNTPTSEDDFDEEFGLGFNSSTGNAFASTPATSAGSNTDNVSGGAAFSGSTFVVGGSAAAAASTASRLDLWTLTDQPGIDMFLAGPLAWGKLNQVFVILFGVGERDTEGIYSLRAFSEEGLPQDTIIAFESEDDAQRYAGLLEATMDHLPNVCSIAPRELLDFCLDHGYNCRLEPTDSLLIPPDFNVGMTDWERSLRLREGVWAVLADEPDCASPPPAGGGWAGPGLPHKPSGGTTALVNLRTKSGVNSSTLARYAGMSDLELENIRARLERLLPSEM